MIDRLGNQLGDTLNAILDIPGALSFVLAGARDAEVRQIWLEVAGKLVLVILAGLAAEWFVRRAFGSPRRQLVTRETTRGLTRIAFRLINTAFDIVAVAAFAVGAYSVLSLTQPRPVTLLVAIAIINANVFVRIVMLVARMFLAPESANLRLVRVSDEMAHYLIIWIRRITVFAVCGYFLVESALLLGSPEAAVMITAKVAGLFFTGMVIVFVMQNRAEVAAWLRGAKHNEAGWPLGGLRRLVAETWHLLAVLLAIAAYLVWAFDMEGGLYFLVRAVLTTLVALTFARLIIGGLRTALRRGFGLRDEIRRRFPGLEARADRYVKVLQRAAEVLIYVAAGLVLLDAWGI